MRKDTPKVDRKLQKNQIRQKTTALIILDQLINDESDAEKIIKLKSIRKELKKICMNDS